MTEIKKEGFKALTSEEAYEVVGGTYMGRMFPELVREVPDCPCGWCNDPYTPFVHYRFLFF